MENITMQMAYEVIHEYPEQEWYIQDHFQIGLRGGEYWDNSLDTYYYWAHCKEMVDRMLPMVIVNSGYRFY